MKRSIGDVAYSNNVGGGGGGGGGGGVAADEFFVEPAPGFSDHTLLSQITNKKIYDLLKLMRYQKNCNNLEIEIDSKRSNGGGGDVDYDDDVDDHAGVGGDEAAAAADDDDLYNITILPSSFV